MAQRVLGLNDPQSQDEMAKANSTYFDPRLDAAFQRKPERHIYVHTVSRREFTISRAPLFSKLLLRACPADERSILCTSIPDPFLQPVHDTESGRQRAETLDGLRIAIDLLNPNNPTMNPDWEPSPEAAALFSTSKSCDLFAQGFFLSYSDVASEREIAKAEGKRNKRYRTLIAHADRLEAINRKELEEFLQGEDGTDLRMALDHYSEQRSYHKPMIATATCPNCGDSIKSGVAFHKSEVTGTLCIIDWPRAVKAGVKTRDDVPEDERWWDDEPAGEDDARPTGKGRGKRQ